MLAIGKRPIRTVFSALFDIRHYIALRNMFTVYAKPVHNLIRYLLNSGSYPYQISLGTPCGSVHPRLFSYHDLQTVNEVFCRLDYFADMSRKVILDIGSNIGISALYFLTRNPLNQVFLFEPVPKNVSRLKENLRGFEQRYKLQTVAVADFSGEVSFATEPTGRYGGIISAMESEQQNIYGEREAECASCSIQVPCLNINDILEEILAREPVIDILKIDIEGYELNVLNAIDNKHLEKIQTIYIELSGQDPQQLVGFETTCRGGIQIFRKR